MKTKLTQASVAKLKPARAGQYVVRDSEQSGFLIVVGKVAKTYAVQLDNRRLGKRVTTRKSIGRADQITANEARARAAAMIAEVRTGSRRLTSRSQRVTLGQSWADYSADLAIQVAAGTRSQRTLDGHPSMVQGDGPGSKTARDAMGGMYLAHGAIIDLGKTVKDKTQIGQAAIPHCEAAISKAGAAQELLTSQIVTLVKEIDGAVKGTPTPEHW